MRDRLTISPERYALVARVALVMLTLIVLTGAAVRVTGSGLGCPTWPKCTSSRSTRELNTHGVIEFGNRLLTFFVGFAAIGAFAAAFMRRPRRRDLVLLGLLLPLGVVAQAVLGGFTVLYDLAPGFVMSHYILSMLILVACVALDWRAHREPPERAEREPADRLVAYGAWSLVPIGAVTIFAGTAASAAGPHAGGAGTGDVIKRLTFKGADTLRFVVEQHARLATLLGLLAVALWVLALRRGATRAAAPAADAAVPHARRPGRRRRRAIRARAAGGDRLGPRRAGGGDVARDPVDGRGARHAAATAGAEARAPARPRRRRPRRAAAARAGSAARRRAGWRGSVVRAGAGRAAAAPW